MDINGKGAVIVGGASGMARGPRSCWRSGARRSRSWTCPPRLKQTWRRRSAAGPTFHPVDVTDESGVEEALAAAPSDLGHWHIAVNTAGGGTARKTISSSGPHPLDEFRRVVELNLVATFNLNRLQAWHMKDNEPEDEERGVIINTASIAAFEGQVGQVAYTASKAGIAGMSLTMARDLGSYGIRVNAIAPSVFATGDRGSCSQGDGGQPHEGCGVPPPNGPARGVCPPGRGDH
jgi:NAD(P)-dependent dehydrogenase (short-subunit alcohol dehydrogenase family)